MNNVIKNWILTVTVAALATVGFADPAGEHGHDHAEKMAGPNGGRVIEVGEPQVEFWIREDRRIQISFLSEDGKAVEPVAGLSFELIGGERTAPTQLRFAREGLTFVSDVALPEGDSLPLVLTIVGADGKKTRERFYANVAECSECAYQEYACVCAH